MKRLGLGGSLGLAVLMLPAAAIGNSGKDFLKSYKGLPYEDSHYHGGAQKIPGRVDCAYYDRGGEGVAYHDSDAKNNGSGGLNPADILKVAQHAGIGRRHV